MQTTAATSLAPLESLKTKQISPPKPSRAWGSICQSRNGSRGSSAFLGVSTRDSEATYSHDFGGTSQHKNWNRQEGSCPTMLLHPTLFR